MAPKKDKPKAEEDKVEVSKVADVAVTTAVTGAASSHPKTTVVPAATTQDDETTLSNGRQTVPEGDIDDAPQYPNGNEVLEDEDGEITEQAK